MSGLAVHWEDEILFWSDMNLGHIMYSQLDGRYHAFLLTGLVKPKSLAVDPIDGSVLHIDHRWSRYQVVRV